MKKRISFLGILIPIMIGISGCVFDAGVVGNGRTEMREIQIHKALTGVLNAGSFQVVIDPSLQGRAVLEGESNVLDLVDAGQNDDGMFEIAFEPGTSIFSIQTVTVRVPAVNGGVLEVSGSGGIRLEGNAPLAGRAFDLRINGSGDIDLSLRADELKAGVFGSGNMDVEGRASDADIEINGSGNFSGLDCETSNASIRIAGSGNASISAGKKLVCEISGSGNVTYQGEPSELSVTGSGSGQVNKSS